MDINTYKKAVELINRRRKLEHAKIFFAQRKSCANSTPNEVEIHFNTLHNLTIEVDYDMGAALDKIANIVSEYVNKEYSHNIEQFDKL